MPLSWLPAFVAVDIETSGLAAQQDDLLELAGVKFANGEVVDRFDTTLKSDKLLGARTAQMTGLTDIALAEGLPTAEAVRALDAFVGSMPIVAHNVHLDREFLQRFSHGLEEVDFTQNEWWDSLELAALVFPELESLALDQVANALAIDVGVTHRALADAELAGRVFSQLFSYVMGHWPDALVERVRGEFLPDHAFGQILQGLVRSGNPTGPARRSPAPTRTAASAGGRVAGITLVRVRDDEAAIRDFTPQLRAGHPGLLTYPPLLYPGQFAGPEKQFRQACEDAGLYCYPGLSGVVDPAKVERLLAGQIPVPTPLDNYEKALLHVWAQTSPTGEFARLSWWVLNNYPHLAQTLPRIAADPSPESGAYRAAHAETLAQAPACAVPWELAVAHHQPFTTEAQAAAQFVKQAPDVAILKPEYWPLQALRGAQLSLDITGLRATLALLAPSTTLAEPHAAWVRETLPLLQKAITELEQELADSTAGSEENLPATVRGDETYWPLRTHESEGRGHAAISRGLGQVIALANASGRRVEDLLAVESPGGAETLQRTLQQVQSFCQRAAWALERQKDLAFVVQRRAPEGAPAWWSLECFPRLSRSLRDFLPATVENLTLYTSYLDAEDWHTIEEVWGTRPAPEFAYRDASPPIPAGNTAHVPLPPPGYGDIPAKKVWQNWQLAILRRLLKEESGRWLIVARNPQDVSTLQFRLREHMLKCGWQPLFQRHDGTKGFLMREYGGFEKVVMVGTGEILQELDRFPTPPTALVVLHVPTRPPNDIACVALQEQFGYNQHQFRDLIYFPLGVLELKRALYHWPAFREGRGNFYLLDFKQLEHTGLRALINAEFSNQELLDTQPAARY